jgi:hypothetical protein
MKFESLHHVLCSVARCKDASRIVGRPEFRHAWQITEAAKDLQQQLCNVPELQPRWAENRRNRHIFNNGVAEEGMALLDTVADWYHFEESRLRAYFAMKSRLPRAAVTPLVEPVVEEIGQWTREEFLRALTIGFDRLEVVRFLDATRISYRFDDHWADPRQDDGVDRGLLVGVPKHSGLGDIKNLPGTAMTVRVHSITRRPRVLTAPIDEAIRKAGNMNTATVLMHLREMALAQTLPFTGVMAPDGGLFYTDENGVMSVLTRSKLTKHLWRRRCAAKEASDFDPKAPRKC